MSTLIDSAGYHVVVNASIPVTSSDGRLGAIRARNTYKATYNDELLIHRYETLPADSTGHVLGADRTF